jgi:hypothetical protein
VLLREAVENLNPPAIDKLDARTIQMDGSFLSQIRAALPVQQRRPLIRDLPFQLEEDIASTFPNFCDLQHRLVSCSMIRLLSNCNANRMARQDERRK